MLIDDKHVFSDDQAITATAVSTNTLLFGEDDIGKGEPVFAVVQVTEQFDSGADDGTLTITLQHNDSGWADLRSTAAIAELTLAPGYQVEIAVPPDTKGELRLNYTVAGSGDFTEGVVFAYLSPSRAA